MKRNGFRHRGCLLGIIPLVAVAYFLFGPGLARTVAPVAQPIALGDLTLRIECAADAQELRGTWPITYVSECPDIAVIRGELRSQSPQMRSTDYRIAISTAGSVTRITRCVPGYRDACYFNADLRPAKLTEGLSIEVSSDQRAHFPTVRARIPFKEKTSYSLARWDAIMGI